jgi:hypothetical protein
MPFLGRAHPQRGQESGSRELPALLATQNPGALTQWTNALFGLNSTPARWLAIGTGVTEGQGASTRANRWIDQVLSTIRTAKGSPTGQQFVSAAYGVTGTDSPWATTGVALAGATTVATTSGVGYRMQILSQGSGAAGQFGTSTFGTASFGGTTGGSTPGSVTFTVTGTTADVWYVSELGAGTFTYTVDAGSPTSVSTDAPHDIQRIAGIPLGANASHTVAINATAGTVYISGLTVYGTDAGTGIHLYDAARTNIVSSTYTANMTDTSDVAATIAPDLVTIDLGYNDAAAGINPGQTVSNINSIITMLRSLPKVPSIVIVINPYPSGASLTSSWPDFVPGLRQLAVDGSLGLIDLTVPMPLADLSGTGLYRTDGRHPNDSGYTSIATTASSLLNVAVTPAPGPSTSGAGRGLLFSNIA